MNYTYNMPHKKDLEGGGGGSSKKLYRPLPEKAGSKVANEVFISLFSPTNWKMFNPSAEDAQKYGIRGGGGLVSLPPELATFYFKIPVHQVSDFVRPDGSVGFSYVICPIKLNKYLVEFLEFEPMFENPRCAHCEKEQEWWNEHNKRWAELGYDDDTKKHLDNTGYNNIIDNDPVLKKTRSVARSYKTNDRYIINIFDHAKWSSARPLDDGQTSVEFQLWFAPRSIFEKLMNIYETTGIAFFDTSQPDGVTVISVIKDTTECSDRDLRRTKYDALAGRKVVYPPELLGYLNDYGGMVDPSELVHFPVYEDMKHHLGGDSPQSAATNAPAPQLASGVVPPPQPNMPNPGISQPSVPTPPGQAPAAPAPTPAAPAPASVPVPSAPAQHAGNPVAPVAPTMPVQPTQPAGGPPIPPPPPAAPQPPQQQPASAPAATQAPPPAPPVGATPQPGVAPDRVPPAANPPGINPPGGGNIPSQKHKW
jgi:hypothetical protein